MDQPFSHIFKPLRIGPVTVTNRLFVSAHHSELVEHSPDGYRHWSVFGERAMHYFAERAKGGFGLIMIGQTQVHPQSGPARPASFIRELVVPRYARIAEACHEHGAKVMVQLNQNGPEKLKSGPDSWEPPWAPSGLVNASPEARGEMPKEMELEDIEALLEGYAQSAKNVQESGMDGVEIHAAHTHLYGLWLGPAMNKRTDRYGGSLENRLRIVLESVDAVRRACGKDFAIGVRINGAWTVPGGQTLEEGVQIARMLEATGQIDFLNVSGWPGIGSIGSPFGGMIPWAAAVKKAVTTVPVFGIGRVVDPRHAERILAEGLVDMVGMTRASIADPELPNKAREGRLEEIRFCMGAAQGCLTRNGEAKPITCTQNPAVGLERDWGIGTMKPAGVRRKVLVVGGGPAGLEAAMIAATRGHQVTLYEKSTALGGQINLITRVERRREFQHVVDWRRGQLKRLNVEVKLGVEVTPEMVQGLGAGSAGLRPGSDAVIIATGSTPRRVGWYPAMPHIAAIPGSDQPHVFTVWDALLGRLAGKRHVVLIDATSYHQSTDALEYLAGQGAKVSAVCHTPLFAAAINGNDRPDMMAALRGKDVTFFHNTLVQRISAGSVEVLDIITRRESAIKDVDAVVVSIGNDANAGLYQALKGRAPSLHRIGDCVAPRGVEHAVYEGHKVGRMV